MLARSSGLLLITLLACSAAQADGFVWRAHGTNNTVYLAGSMHLLPERAYPLPASYEQAYSDSRILVEEADQQALQSGNARQALLTAARYEQGDLKSHIDPAMFKATAALLDRADLSLARMRAFRPWFVSIAIELAAFQSKGYKADLGLDGYFDSRARLDDKPILALQPLERHLAILTEMPPALSRDQLAATLDSAAELDTAADELYDYWQTGNVHDFAASVDEQAAGYPALYDRLIYDRNQAWMTTIEALFNSPDNAMVLVGAAHLVGPEGLVSLLRNKGYRIERMD